MVYLGNAELAAKPAGQLYYKNDTHWNALGGIYGGPGGNATGWVSGRSP